MKRFVLFILSAAAVRKSRIYCAGLALFVLAQLFAGCQAFAQEALPGITFSSETQTNPPQRLFIARVDLTNPRVHLHVSRGGPDPDGPGAWQTTLLQPTKVAARENFDFVINGDFFAAKGTRDGEGTNSHYHAEQWARVTGPAMTDGLTWSTTTNYRPCLVVHTNGAVTIDLLTRPAPDDWEVISGNAILVYRGQVLPHKNQTRNPRTAVGLDASEKHLIILVVDGRKPGVAAGMSYEELAAEMLRLGCQTALNLDGGGSSVMAMRGADGVMKILNVPTDGHERAVANVLGISIDRY
jgi:hypothetical protein